MTSAGRRCSPTTSSTLSVISTDENAAAAAAADNNNFDYLQNTMMITCLIANPDGAL